VWSFVAAAVLPLVAIAAARSLAGTASVTLADAPALGWAARRTEALRAALVVLLVGALILAALLLRTPASGIGQLVPGGRTTVVVLDMSASISDLVYAEIARTLQLITTERRDAAIGLVLFSDVGHEVLPLGTPARELMPFIRFFEPLSEPSARPRPDYYRPAGPAAPAPIKYVLSPWYAGFSGGTTISAGLATARAMIERDGGGHVGVLLVSDLDNKPADREVLPQELVAYARAGITLDVVAVPPGTDERLRLYEGIAGGTVIRSRELAAVGASGAVGAGAPLAAVAVVCALALLLAAYERSAAPLAWTARRRP
jgi:hypothetical protein